MSAEEYKIKIEQALEKCFLPPKALENHALNGLAESMRYSLLAGGKRIRPMLALEFCRISGGDVDKAMPVALALEMLHTYSLIHDDLPSMDNDDLRRGKPTNHVIYGECTAILAGDTLQAEAFGSILRSELPADRKAKCAEILADAVGLEGMWQPPSVGYRRAFWCSPWPCFPDQGRYAGCSQFCRRTGQTHWL